MSLIAQTCSFLLKTLGGLYIGTFILRFLLQEVRANFYNPTIQPLILITNPLLIPLRRVIPGYKQIDTASLLAIFGLTFVKVFLLFLFGKSILPGFFNVVFLSFLDIINNVLTIFTYSLLFQGFFSWISTPNPLSNILYEMNRPLTAFAAKYIPPIAGLDLSILFLIIGLQIVQHIFLTSFIVFMMA